MIFIDQIASVLLFILALSIIHQSAFCGEGRERVAFRIFRVSLAILGISVLGNTLFKLVPISPLGGVVWKSCVNAMLVGIIILIKAKYNRV